MRLNLCISRLLTCPGPSDPCMARAHPRSLLGRLVQHQEGYLHLIFVGWDCKARTSSMGPSELADHQQWTPERNRSILSLQAHQSCVYQALFSPHQPDIVGTCSTDGTAKVFDLRSPSYASGTNTFTNPLNAAVLTIPASGTEVLSLDWNKYRPWVIATGGVDKIARVWDCRMIKPQEVNQVGGVCETQLLGHEYAVRKVQWSPHRPDVLATASYDMTCRVYVRL